MKPTRYQEGRDPDDPPGDYIEHDHGAECSIGSRCDRCIRFGFIQPLGGGDPARVCLDCGEPAK